jgi:hypothetical protein
VPRFVILDHDQPFRHWDFLLECGEVLRAWRLRAEPVPDAPIVAEPLPDHRLIYLEYEGPVGGGRGRVLRWDAGKFEWECDVADEALIRIAGERVCGRVRLHRADGVWTWQLSQ